MPTVSTEGTTIPKLLGSKAFRERAATRCLWPITLFGWSLGKRRLFMRILSVVRKNYYGVATAIEPMHLYFTMPLKEMGHSVETFDHYEMSRTLGGERATLALADKIRKGEFDVVFYQTSGREPVETAALAELSR